MTNRQKCVYTSAFFVCVAVLFASNGVINVSSPNRVSNENLTGFRWEPSTASGSSWATSWATFPSANTKAATSYASGWNGGWLGPVALTPPPPNNVPTSDVNLSYDSIRGRFVFTALALSPTTIPTIWYGYSTDSIGSNWVFGNKNAQGIAQPVFSASAGDWDYPSIGVDSTGRVVIGGVNLFPSAFDVAISTDGEHFTSPVALPISNAGTNPGARSRIVAAGSAFEAFVPTLQGAPFFLPTAVNRYESFNGVNWTGPNLIMAFAMPSNSAQPSGLSHPIFYAPLLSAAGYTDGRWIVGFQRNIVGWNNIEICTSDRGLGTLNMVADDQFLAGVSVSADGYWVGYHTYSTVNNRSLPVITQAVYFKTGATGIGATTNPNILVTSWAIAGVPNQYPTTRCISQCYAAGDFNTPSSNPFAASNTAYVQNSSRQDDLFQTFQQDPQGVANAPNFVPNFIPHPLGADLSAEGLPVPPESEGVSPEITRGF